MAQDDDDLPRPRKRLVESIPLDPLAVAELRDYIGDLQAEIARVEAAIAAKQGQRSAAEAVFGRPKV